jgi:hypothetical protein
MKTALMIGVVALMSGCATMSSRPGDFSVSGLTGDPTRATAVAGSVTTRQYDAETQRLNAKKMVERGMNPAPFAPANVNGYGYGYGNAHGGDYWFNYRSRGIIPHVQQPAAMPAATLSRGVSAAPAPNGPYATQQDIARVEGKADDGLCLHWKQKPENRNKPLNQCPLKK